MKFAAILAVLLTLTACDQMRMPTPEEIDLAAEIARRVAEGAP